MIATLARLAVAVGIALIVAGTTQPAPQPVEPVHHRPATAAEERAWQIQQLARLIDEHRATQQ